MLPEVKEFFAVKKEVDTAWEAWERNARKSEPRRNWGMTYGSPEYNEFNRAYALWSEDYNATYREVKEDHSITMREARATMRRNTKDPMLMWMMDNVFDRWVYIETVLPILPATRDQLENLANDHQWCTEFDSFLDQATEAGVIPPPEEKFDISELLEWISEEYDVNEREIRRQIQSRVNRIVEKALAAHNNNNKQTSENVLSIA